MIWPFKRRVMASAAVIPQATPARRRMKIKDAALSMGGSDGRPGSFMLTPLSEAPISDSPFSPLDPTFKGQPKMAFDDGVQAFFTDAAAFNFSEGIGFLGYGYLAELAQRAEYRRGSEVLAREMTRRWIRFTYEGEADEAEDDLDDAETDEETDDDKAEQVPGGEDPVPPTQDPKAQPTQPKPGDNGGPPLDDNAEKLKLIEREFKRLKVRDCFRRAAELDGFFGRGHIYIDTGDTDKPNELKTPLMTHRGKIKSRGIKRLTVVEPQWTYPQDYNSRDPLKAQFFQPQSWLVMAKKVHASRLLTFVGREVPDMLKPAYSFGGLSLSQMAKPYVDNWLRTRQSVSDLLHSFTVWGLKTDLSALLGGADDGDQMVKRAQLFNQGRDNRGMMMIDKETEDFFNVSVPLGTLDHLLAQSQEQMSSVFAIPLVVFLGVTPSGLNASSDGEIRVFYDFIAAFQEHLFGHAIEKLLKLVQLSLFGEVDEDIGFEFLPLWQPTETDKATIRKTEMEIDTGYVNAGVLDPVEVRQKLADDRDGSYQNLDVSAVPEDPNALPPGMNPITGEVDGDPSEPNAEGDDDDDPSSGAPPGPPKPPEPPGAPKPPGMDAEFKEGDHPRGQPGNAGQFGSGGGGSGSGKSKTAPNSGAASGFGTSNLEKGSVVGFKAGGGKELSGKVVELTKTFARVQVEGGEVHRVPFDRITAGTVNKGKTKVAEPQASGERGEHFIPPDQFNATEYGKSTDDPDVTVDDILASFPEDTTEKISDAIARLRSIEETVSLFKKDGVYSPERAALHRQIMYEGITRKVIDEKTGELADKFFPGIISPEKIKSATPAAGERPTFTILGGRGGSGKSKLKGVAYDPNKALVLNSDDIKEMLPEYEGWNAGQVHEESSEIFDIVDAFAKSMGLNVVHDVTMKTPEKAVSLVEDFKKRGYRIEAHYMHLPRQEAAKRAIGRFLGKTKRLVSPELILGNTRNEEAFEAVKSMADKWSFRDNNVEGPNTPAKLISEGGSDVS